MQLVHSASKKWKKKKGVTCSMSPSAGIDVSAEQRSGEKIEEKKNEHWKFGNMQVIEEKPNPNPDLM